MLCIMSDAYVVLRLTILVMVSMTEIWFYTVWESKSRSDEHMHAKQILLGILEGIAHPNIKIMSLFTHSQVVPKLYDICSYVEQKRIYFEECW